MFHHLFFFLIFYLLIQNFYIIKENGNTGEFIDDFDGYGAKGGYQCSNCGISTKRRTLRALKRIAMWKE